MYSASLSSKAARSPVSSATTKRSSEGSWSTSRTAARASGLRPSSTTSQLAAPDVDYYRITGKPFGLVTIRQRGIASKAYLPVIHLMPPYRERFAAELGLSASQRHAVDSL